MTTTLWRGLENLGDWKAVPGMWQSLFGADFERIARTWLVRTGEDCTWVPSKAVCQCALRVVQHSDDDIVGVSDCETGGCNDVKLSRADIELLALSRSKVARGLATAFGWDYREAETGIGHVRQIGTYGTDCLPVLFVIPEYRHELLMLSQSLIGHFGGNFLLLVPTARSIDGNAQSALRKVNAGLFALEGLVTLGPDGSLQANRSTADLFGQFQSQRTFAQPAGVPVLPSPRYLFQHAGSFWKVVFDGGPEFVIEDTLGAKYLNYLLHRPNEGISAFDLEVAITPEKAKVRAKDSIQRKLDPEAARQYLRELTKLRAQRDEAVQDGDLGEAERLDDDIESIEAELKNGGAPADTGERARSNVNKALAAVRKKLENGDKHQKAFRNHILQFVDIGYECVYRHPEGRVWG